MARSGQRLDRAGHEVLVNRHRIAILKVKTNVNHGEYSA
jgi:hypothetical protein